MAGTDIRTLEALYASLSTGQRRKLMRGIITDVRREQLKRIAKQRDPDGAKFAPRAPAQNRADQARGPMFPKMRLIKNTLIQSNEREGVMGFKGRTERIARVHQFGEKDVPRKGWRPVRYPVRQLLGISSETERIVMASIEKHLLK